MKIWVADQPPAIDEHDGDLAGVELIELEDVENGEPVFVAEPKYFIDLAIGELEGGIHGQDLDGVVFNEIAKGDVFELLLAVVRAVGPYRLVRKNSEYWSLSTSNLAASTMSWDPIRARPFFWVLFFCHRTRSRQPVRKRARIKRWRRKTVLPKR